MHTPYPGSSVSLRSQSMRTMQYVQWYRSLWERESVGARCRYSKRVRCFRPSLFYPLCKRRVWHVQRSRVRFFASDGVGGGLFRLVVGGSACGDEFAEQGALLLLEVAQLLAQLRDHRALLDRQLVDVSVQDVDLVAADDSEVFLLLLEQPFQLLPNLLFGQLHGERDLLLLELLSFAFQSKDRVDLPASGGEERFDQVVHLLVRDLELTALCIKVLASLRLFFDGFDELGHLFVESINRGPKRFGVLVVCLDRPFALLGDASDLSGGLLQLRELLRIGIRGSVGLGCGCKQRHG